MKRKYPILVHTEEGSAYGVTIPDIPGCFTAGDTIEEAVANVQAAVECYYEGEEIKDLPTASKIEDLMQHKDLYVESGFWVLAEVDFSFLSKKTVRVNITVPKLKLAMIDRFVKEKGFSSRSAFLVHAAESISKADTHI